VPVIAAETVPVIVAAIERARLVIAPEPKEQVRVIAPKAAAPSRRATAPAQVLATALVPVRGTGPAAGAVA
jgi:hypothetical protein